MGRAQVVRIACLALVVQMLVTLASLAPSPVTAGTPPDSPPTPAVSPARQSPAPSMLETPAQPTPLPATAPAPALVTSAGSRAAGEGVATPAPVPSPTDEAADLTAQLQADDYRTAVMADAPYAYWRLGETSGTTAADSSGSGLNGTISGTVTHGAAGIFADGSNTAMTFGGGWAQLPAGFSNVGGGLTIEAWLNPDAPGIQAHIIDLSTGTDSNTIQLVRPSNSNHLQFKINLDDRFGPDTYAYDILQPGVWQHIAVTLDANRQAEPWCSFSSTTGSIGS